MCVCVSVHEINCEFIRCCVRVHFHFGQTCQPQLSACPNMELNLCVDLYRLLVTAVYSVGTFQAGCLRELSVHFRLVD